MAPRSGPPTPVSYTHLDVYKRQVSEEDEGIERYRFGVEAMESEDVRVLTTNDLARAAETAKADLRL